MQSMKAAEARHYSHGSVFSILQTCSEMPHAPKINKDANEMVNIGLRVVVVVVVGWYLVLESFSSNATEQASCFLIQAKSEASGTGSSDPGALRF